MSIAAIIAEYNPFHTGHLYQIEKVKKLTGADHIVVIMSGNFVQRGTPALFDKYTRTKMALNLGVDAVIELPVFYSCSSAEYFAAGAVNLIIALNCVDYLCFGCETTNLSVLNSIAKVLADEPDEFKLIFQELISNGTPYAKAKTDALLNYFSFENSIDLKKLLTSPNSILGIEYLKSLYVNNSDIQPVIIKREGDFHSDSLTNDFASASAIRECIFNSTSTNLQDNNYMKFIPEINRQLILNSEILHEDDFSNYLLHQIVFNNNLSEFFGVSEFMANSITNLINTNHNLTFTDITNSLSGKHTSTARCRRALLHIILELTDSKIKGYINNNYNMYIRLLGFNKPHSEILKELKNNSKLPLISKMADCKNILSDDAYQMLLHNIKCDDLYRITMNSKYKKPVLKNEFNTGIIISN